MNVPSEGDATKAARIDLSNPSEVVIEWGDGHCSRWHPAGLRTRCLCAHCNEFRRAGQPVWPRPGQPETVKVDEAELVGAYGITFFFSDGHSHGIYRWDKLREWCPCDECREKVEQ